MREYISFLEIINQMMGMIGVIVGSVITSRIESIKLKNEEDKKLLRNLYFEIYTELEHCYLTQNGFRSIGVYIDLKQTVSISAINGRIEKLLKDKIDTIDSSLFQLYHKIRTEQYYNDVTGGIAEYEYLLYYASLLKDMIVIFDKAKMSNRYLSNLFKNLYFEYSVWYSLMKRILDWEKVEAILGKSFLFKRSFKKIQGSVFLKNIYSNKKMNEDEFIKLFEKYCFNEIKFPIFNKYFWI